MTPAASLAESLDVLARHTVDLIERRDLEQRLKDAAAAGRPLRVKFGMDPSSPDLHVGHSVQLLKLRAVQELGHTIVLIVGDATAMVGDPTGRNKLRPQLTRAEVDANLETYTTQAARVLDMERTEVHRNSTWFDAMGFEDVLRLCGRMTVARMIERDTFQKRMEAREAIGIHEFLYPLMQGWDSVQIRADVELGGTDQLFNLLVGRQLQEQEGQAPQVCMTLPLINGLDGRKMSKSYGNAVAFTDAPRDMYGKVMSIADDVMPEWFRLTTTLPEAEVEAILAGHPRQAKARLARELVAFYHDDAAAADAAAAFDAQFAQGETPDDVPEHAFPADGDELPLANLLRELGLVKSTSDARRMVQQGAVKLDGERATDPMAPVARPAGDLLVQVGKRRFARVRG